MNSKRPNVLGIKAYPKFADLPDKVDLVVVTTPADTVPDLLAESVEMGIPAGIVISAGFKEHGEHGKELERRDHADHPRQDAPDRPQLPGRDESDSRA